MKNQFMNMMQWQAKGPQQQQHHNHHHHHDQEQLYGSDNNEYQLVKNGRPYGTIVFSCDDQSGAFKSEEEQMMMMQNPSRITNAATHHHLHHNRPRMQNHHQAYTSYEDPDQYFPRKQFLNNPIPAAVVDDDINDEAEEFIQMEHKKFNFFVNNNKNKRTWSSG